MIELTPIVDVWDPHDTICSEQEYSMIDYKGAVKQAVNRNSVRKFIAASVITNVLDPVSLDQAISELGDGCASNTHYVSSIRCDNKILYIDRHNECIHGTNV